MSPLRTTLALLLALALALGLYCAARVGSGARTGADEAPEAERAAPTLAEATREPAATPTAREPVLGDALGPTRLVRLRVVDGADRAPIAGARVTLCDRPEPATLVTDAEGRCTLLALEPPRERDFTVEAPGFVTLRWNGTLEGEVTQSLERATELRVRVVAADTGEPVAGARVEYPCPGMYASEHVRLVSASDGRLELHELPLGRTLTLTLAADGFATLAHSFQLRPGGVEREHELRLPRGVRLRGRVVDHTTGEGLAGARVSEIVGALPVGGLVADGAGRFDGRVLSPSGDAPIELEVSAEGHVELRARLALDADGETEAEFRLPLPAFVEGEVRDHAGAPAEGVTLQFFAGFGPEHDEDGTRLESSPLYELPEGWEYGLAEDSTRSDASGRYRLAVLPWSLNAEVNAGSERFVKQRVPLRALGGPGSVQRIDWRLAPDDPTPYVRGSVSLEGETPWYFAGTVAWRGPTRSGAQRLEGNGGFAFLAEAGALELSASLDALPGVTSAPLCMTLAPYELRNVSLELQVPERTITGEVRDADGAPLAGLVLEGVCGVPHQARRVLHGSDTLTDERGRYVLRVVDLGTPFVVRCRAPLEELERAEVPAGAQGVDFQVERGRRLLVRVRDAQSGEVFRRDEAFQLLFRAPGRGFERHEPLAAQPDPGGYVEYALAAERVQLLLLPRESALPGHAPLFLDAVTLDAAAPTVLDLALAPGAALELHAESALPEGHSLYLIEDALWDELRPPARFAEAPFDTFGAGRRVAFDAQGNARLAGLTPGLCRFKLFPDDLVLEPASLVVDAQPAEPVVVRWRRAP